MKKFFLLFLSMITTLSLLSGCITKAISDQEDIVYIQVAGPFYTSSNPSLGKQERLFLREREKTVAKIVGMVDKATTSMFKATDGFIKFEDNLLDALKKDEPDSDSTIATDKILNGIAAYHSLLDAHEAEIKEYDKTKTTNSATMAIIEHYKLESAVKLYVLQNQYLEWLKTASAVTSSTVSRSNERRANKLLGTSASIFAGKIYNNMVEADIQLNGALSLYDALMSMDYYASFIYLEEAGQTIEDIRQGKTDSNEPDSTIEFLDKAIKDAIKSLEAPENLKPIPDISAGNLFITHVMAEENQLPDLGLLSDSMEYYRDAPIEDSTNYPTEDQAEENFAIDLADKTNMASESSNPGAIVSESFAEAVPATDITTDIRATNRIRSIGIIKLGQLAVRGAMLWDINDAYSMAVSRISSLIAGGRNISQEASENAINLIKTELNDLIGESREDFLNALLRHSAEETFQIFEAWRDDIGNLNEHEFTREDLENFLVRLGYEVDVPETKPDDAPTATSTPTAHPSASTIPPAPSPTPTPAETDSPDDPEEYPDESYAVFNIAATYDTLMNLSNRLTNENILSIIYGWADPIDYQSLQREDKPDGEGGIRGWRYLDSSGSPYGWEVTGYSENIEYIYHFPKNMESSMKIIRYGNLEESAFFQIETEDKTSGRKTAIRFNEDPQFAGDSITYIYETENGIKDGLNTTRYNSNPTFELYINGNVYESHTFLNGNLIREVITSYEGSSVIEHTKLFYESGVLRQETYEQDGEKFGTYTSFNKEGVLVLSIGYKDGRYDGEYKSFFDDGTLRDLTTYKDGEKDGPATGYYSNDGHPLEYTGSYEGNEKDGRWETYTAEGLPKTIIEYKSGLADGEYK
ncbi:MAG: hypothetical protein JXN10_09735, partial [Clostridia bacterium]|nr:hypothetical protein [Clostridia bacterium]